MLRRSANAIATQRVGVYVEDAMGSEGHATTSVRMKPFVMPPNGNISALLKELLPDNGDPYLTLITLLTLFNSLDAQSPNNTLDDNREKRSALLHSLSDVGINASQPSLMTSMTSGLATITDVFTQIDENATDVGLTLATSLAKLDTLDRVGVKFIARVASNLLKASKNNRDRFNCSDTRAENDGSRISKLVDDISTASVENIMPGEPPVRIKTSSFELEVHKRFGDTWAGETLGTVGDGGTVVLPNIPVSH